MRILKESRVLRLSLGTLVLAGGGLLLAPQAAFACTPEPNGCCSCEAHIHRDTGVIHTTCCCWSGNGSFNGCSTSTLQT